MSQPVGEMESDNIRIAGLGRPFTLGMFYDARKDELIPGFTLWDEKTLQEKTVERVQPGSTFNITASDSFESKSSLMDINASLKASFMAGLIEVQGSAKYLNDKKKSMNQSRVTCQYNATTNFRELLLNNLTVDTKQKEFIMQGSATHVVTGILYGASGIFVFDSEKVESSNVQEISGSMEAVIKKIPSFDVSGKVDLDLTEEEKALAKKFSCTFYGDFVLKSNPVKFEDAVNTYAELPKLLGEKGENTVPVVVWLMPLTHFDPKAAELIGEISPGSLRKVQDVLEDLREIERRCNDALEDKVVGNIPQIRHQLNRFQEYCHYHESDLKKTIAVELPLIRAGKKENESPIKKLFVDPDKSPFSHDKLSKWMDHKEREINVIRSCADTMEGMKFVQNQSELDREVLAPGVEDALCFVFTSLGGDDPYLDEMAKYVDAFEVESANEDQWYYSAEVITKMREKAIDVQDLAKVLKNNKQFRFLVASLPNDKYKGATIYQYKNGNLVTQDFSKPAPPAVETITDRRDLIWYACDLTLDPDTANNQLHLSEGNKKATRGKQQTDLPDNLERFDAFPQVLCKDSLQGSHYWEVEMSNNGKEYVYIAVAYKGVERKSQKSLFGQNDHSWSFLKCSPDTTLHAFNNAADLWSVPLPTIGFTRVGVYLDWPAGTLSFYTVSSNTLSHLYTFRTKFTEPVYAGLFVETVGSYALLNLGLAQNGALGGKNVGRPFLGRISVQQIQDKFAVFKRGRGAGRGESR